MNSKLAFALGRCFALGRAMGLGVKMGMDASKWITVHPNGKGIGKNGEKKKGQPVLIDDNNGEVLGGMGGKFNGQHISNSFKGGAQHGSDLAIYYKKHQGEIEAQRKAEEAKKQQQIQPQRQKGKVVKSIGPEFRAFVGKFEVRKFDSDKSSENDIENLFKWKDIRYISHSGSYGGNPSLSFTKKDGSVVEIDTKTEDEMKALSAYNRYGQNLIKDARATKDPIEKAKKYAEFCQLQLNKAKLAEMLQNAGVLEPTEKINELKDKYKAYLNELNAEINGQEVHEVEPKAKKEKSKIEPAAYKGLSSDALLNVDPAKQATTPKEAVARLQGLGVNKIGSKLKSSDMFVSLANRVANLTEAFPYVKQIMAAHGLGLSSTSMRNALGICVCTLHPRQSTAAAKIALNESYLSKSAIEKIQQTQESSIVKNQALKSASDDEHKHLATLTHEFGHYVCVALAYRENESINTIAIKAKRELLDIVRAKTGLNYQEIELKFCSYYGSSNPKEFFAEAFRNAYCGAPNELGLAMQEYMRKNG